MDIYRRKLAVAIEVIAGELERDEKLVARAEAGQAPEYTLEPARNHAYGLRLALSSLSGIIEGYDSPSEPPHIRAINWSRRVLGECPNDNHSDYRMYQDSPQRSWSRITCEDCGTEYWGVPEDERGMIEP